MQDANENVALSPAHTANLIQNITLRQYFSLLFDLYAICNMSPRSKASAKVYIQLCSSFQTRQTYTNKILWLEEKKEKKDAGALAFSFRHVDR